MPNNFYKNKCFKLIPNQVFRFQNIKTLIKVFRSKYMDYQFDKLIFLMLRYKIYFYF
jgi:hypothetical protein